MSKLRRSRATPLAMKAQPPQPIKPLPAPRSWQKIALAISTVLLLAWVAILVVMAVKR